MVEEMGRAESSGLPLAVVTLDLDHFAALNARYGKAAGDHVLADCALVLKLALREGDFVARLGGDEFGVVLPDCDLAPARRLVERLCHALEDHRFRGPGSQSPPASRPPARRHGSRSCSERPNGCWPPQAGRHRTAASVTHTH
jgi:diguanylate cyclase (GGDEF)-like protein